MELAFRSIFLYLECCNLESEATMLVWGFKASMLACKARICVLCWVLFLESLDFSTIVLDPSWLVTVFPLCSSSVYLLWVSRGIWTFIDCKGFEGLNVVQLSYNPIYYYSSFPYIPQGSQGFLSTYMRRLGFRFFVWRAVLCAGGTKTSSCCCFSQWGLHFSKIECFLCERAHINKSNLVSRLDINLTLFFCGSAIGALCAIMVHCS